MVSIALPFPPSTNNLFATVRMGAKTRRVPSGKARAYVKAVADAVQAIGDPKAPDGELRVVIGVHVPDKRARDFDNLLKAPLDALVKAGVLKDDSLIVDLRIYRAGFDKTNPRIIAWLEAA